MNCSQFQYASVSLTNIWGLKNKLKVDEFGVPRGGLLDPFLRFISVSFFLFLVFVVVVDDDDDDDDDDADGDDDDGDDDDD